MIQRGPRVADNFTIISNDHLRDERLSWAARGLLAWLCSHAEGYEITEATVVAAGPSGRDGIRTLLRELEGLGYLRRDRRSVIEGGSVVDYILTDPTLARVGESDSRADQAKQGSAKDETAGQGHSSPRVGESDSRSSVEDQKKTNTKTSSSLRATRLPENFQPSEQMRAWFAAEKLAAAIDGRIEHEKFCDYFAGAPGVKGQKVDWPATWRNWMRTAAERAGRRPGNSVVTYWGDSAQNRPSTTDQKVAQTLELGRRLQAMEESA